MFWYYYSYVSNEELELRNFLSNLLRIFIPMKLESELLQSLYAYQPHYGGYVLIYGLNSSY